MVRPYPLVLKYTCFFLALLLVTISPAMSAAVSPAGHFSPETLFRPSYHGLPVPGPVSGSYVPPPGIMPVIVLSGSPYEMGYQYGLQAPEYIALVRDAAWASARSRSSYAEVMDNCSIYEGYITRELPDFDFLSFFQGLSDAMNDQGVPFSPADPVVMLYYGGRQGPAPPVEEHCTAFAAFGNITKNGLIAGVNFDYYPVPSNSYPVILAMYPDAGNSCILPSGAGRTGSNVVVNDKGLVYIVASSPSQGAGDTGPGITGFLELPYVGMTAGSVPEAEQFLTSSTRAFALNHVIADKSGDAVVLEATRTRYGTRHPADTNSSGYIIATNHYLMPEMKPSQRTWDPKLYYPSSFYRYITAEKEITDNAGSFNYTSATGTLSLTDWWDGEQWHMDDPWSANTINRFRPDTATLYSLVAMPDDNLVSICNGNPGMPYWGTRAPGQSGSYVNYTVGGSPGNMVYQLRSEADLAMWNTVKAMGNAPAPEIARLYNGCEDQYWEAVWWHNRGVLETDKNSRMLAFGRAATGFSGVIARAGYIRDNCAGGAATP